MVIPPAVSMPVVKEITFSLACFPPMLVDASAVVQAILVRRLSKLSEQ